MGRTKKESKEVQKEKTIEDIAEEAKFPCPKCGENMEITGGGKSGTDFKCKCGYNETRLI